MTSPDRVVIRIRPAEDGDRVAIARIHALSWQDTYKGVLPGSFLEFRVHEDRLEKWNAQKILPQDLVLVAEDERNGELLGFIAVWCRPEPFIDNLHVRPGFRSGGTGTALMRAAARDLCRMGHNTAWLWAVCANAGAIRFYERLGGICSDRGEHEIAGISVATVKIHWPNLRCLLTSPS